MENALTVLGEKGLEQVAEKGESLLKTLFGPSFEEFGGMIADQVRLRRFKNQVAIFQKAEEHLKAKGLHPKKVSLKILAPMIEFSSLEEDSYIQEKWADLIANVLTKDLPIALQQKAVDVLKQISSQEFNILSHIIKSCLEQRAKIQRRHIPTSMWKNENFVPKEREIPLNTFDFRCYELSKALSIEVKDAEMSVDNLTAFGLLRWKPEVNVSSNNKSIELGLDKDGKPNSEDVIDDISASIDNDSFALTKFGEEFFKICQYNIDQG